MVQPALVMADFPFGAMKSFSVDSEGQVVRCPLPSSISHARQNFGRAFHHWIGVCAQKFNVPGEKIVLKEMLAEPRSAHVPVSPGGRPHAFSHWIRSAPDIDVMVRNPARKTIGFFRCLPSISAQIIDKLKERGAAHSLRLHVSAGQ